MDETAVIHLECEQGHSSDIQMYGYDLDGAQQIASLMDGTSEYYVSSPRDDPKSMLAHCAVCDTLITASVTMVKGDTETEL